MRYVSQNITLHYTVKKIKNLDGTLHHTLWTCLRRDATLSLFLDSVNFDVICALSYLWI